MNVTASCAPSDRDWETTYKLQGRVTYGTGNFYVNRIPYTDTTSTYVMRAASTITLYEVAA